MYQLHALIGAAMLPFLAAVPLIPGCAYKPASDMVERRLWRRYYRGNPANRSLHGCAPVAAGIGAELLTYAPLAATAYATHAGYGSPAVNYVLGAGLSSLSRVLLWGYEEEDRRR